MISLGQTATASSVYNDEVSKYGAQFAVDGGMQTRWASKDTLAELTIELNPADRFNKISIFEFQDTKKSDNDKDFFTNYRFNRIEAYNIDIWQNNDWLTIYHDEQSMGDCKVIRFPVYYQTSKIRLKVLKANSLPSIYEFNVIDCTVDK